MSEPAAVALGPDQRRRALERMRQDTFDVLVVGGGATGSGAAPDAASRGLSVCLVEAEDLAAAGDDVVALRALRSVESESHPAA